MEGDLPSVRLLDLIFASDDNLSSVHLLLPSTDLLPNLIPY